ncbi:baseplate J/gp47 family protein [Candidatus Pacearchaeota archaeon]|nr:baseplate J/gp47 family protein [Candidatus Pacearchaeota archaeon]
MSNDSPDGQIIGIMAEVFGNLDQALEDVYNAFDPQASGDTSLSKLVLINGITRKEATNSTVEVTLVGLAGVTVPAGSIIKTSDTDEEFTLDAEVVLTGGSDTEDATAVNSGAISALAATLTVISTPIAGWTSVTNVSDATLGQDEETDEELRLRRTSSTATSAKSIVDGIFGSLSELEDVTGVAVLENVTASDIDSKVTLTFDADFVTLNTIDMDINGVAISQVTYTTSHANTISLLDAAILAHADVASVVSADESPGSSFEIEGVTGVTLVITNVVVASGASQSDHTLVTDLVSILSHGIHAIVDGGDDTEIAETIFNTKSVGAQLTGEESEIVVDDQGGNNTIKFSRATDVEIDIQVDIVTDTSEFPGNGDQQIKNALVAYGVTNLNIGDDVILSRLYTPINSIPGHSVTALQISKSGESLGTSNIVLAVNEIAKILDGNITVNVT